MVGGRLGKHMGCSVVVEGCEGKGAVVSGDFGVPGLGVIRRILMAMIQVERLLLWKACLP